MNRIVPYEDLSNSDLMIDAIYEGGNFNDLRDDPISHLMECGTQGGFRKVGKGLTKYAILYSSLSEKDWPDEIDIYSGRFTYYGDNRSPGKQITDTKQGGNRLLENIFSSVHNEQGGPMRIPPIFVFTKHPTERSSRSVQFRGLAAPGFPGLSEIEDLVAIWKSIKGNRFQNYRAIFTLLDIPIIKRTWLTELRNDGQLIANAPEAWLKFINARIYSPLTAEPTIQIRTIEQQTPRSDLETELILLIFDHFKKDPTKFEYFAAMITDLFDPKTIVDEVTRPSIDGGHDAIGRYRLGPEEDSIFFDFHLEAKCYSPGIGGRSLTSIGVKETSRLISRIQHRQFGILVTTSIISRQAYDEIRKDGHPIIFLCGIDIAKLLIKHGFNTAGKVRRLLDRDFPIL